MDHLPCSRLLTVIFLSLCTAVCLPSCCFLFLCQRTYILLTYKSFLLCTFLSCGSGSSIGNYFIRLQKNISYQALSFTHSMLKYVLRMKTFKICEVWRFPSRLGMLLKGEKIRTIRRRIYLN